MDRLINRHMKGFGMTSKFIQCIIGAVVALVSCAAHADITFYEYEGFRGRSFSVANEIRNFANHGFNDRASSVVVTEGRWEVCTDARFGGECRVLRRGSYDRLKSLNLDGKISSTRRVSGSGGSQSFAPPLNRPNYEFHRRPREQVFEARVLSVRKVFGPQEQRCWIEHQDVTAGSPQPSVGGAIAGAIIGGILAHQVGKGRGRDAATAAGAVAGAAAGSRVGRPTNTHGSDSRRCENVSSDQPQYYDVLYEFDDQQYHAQMTYSPGRTILVNEKGVPRQ